MIYTDEQLEHMKRFSSTLKTIEGLNPSKIRYLFSRERISIKNKTKVLCRKCHITYSKSYLRQHMKMCPGVQLSRLVDIYEDLNIDQIEACRLFEKKCIEYIGHHPPSEKGKGFIFQVSAPAGCGKTYMVQFLSKRLHQYNWMFTSPTNKACKVLQTRVKHPVRTLHKFFSGMGDYDSNGDLIWVYQIPLLDETTYNILVIDEASMVSTEMYNNLVSLMKMSNVIILTLGDWCQLPPVNDTQKKYTEDLTPLYKYHPVNIHLTINQRNKGVTINLMLNEIRRAIEDEAHDTITTQPWGIIRFLSHYLGGNVAANLAKGIRNYPDIKAADLDELLKRWGDDDIILAHRVNEPTPTVSRLNKQKRKMLFGDQCEKYEENEKLLFTNFHRTPYYRCPECNEISLSCICFTCNKNTFSPSIQYYTCDRFDVEQCDLIEKDFYEKTFRTWELVNDEGIIIHSVSDEDREAFEQYCYEIRNEIKLKAQNHPLQLPKESKDSYNKRLEAYQISIREQWSTYFNSVEEFNASVDYRYVLSIHKSQGSTFEKVHLYLTDFIWMSYTNQSRKIHITFLRLLYTALSRCSDTAFVC
jgi:hypothetical protein